ncbi:aldehyde dehydrogenase [Sphaerisporangium krabiense]|uniref:Aldehyde dehydrogenase (NAD+) n=1 Tax=Sphaerisporangium krabiense TaxID=763782 RepID=A0A7W8ZBU0_9ACTN|nr:aldehyde dehydrogenase [Sphaerisporangium krabiense]MBB5631050.1 aldehyde dehydrogenase (NAD+) [Sphaerisporangium krabiense]GII65933.1 aldehyde dehydrogenase [Sphaerisporangium krabiense]
MTADVRPPADAQTFPMLVNGRRRAALSGRAFDSLDPSTGRVWARVADGDAADVDAAVRAAAASLDGSWGAFTGFDRARVLRRAGDLILRDLEHLAVLESRDSGRLLKDTRAQVGYVAEWFHYFAGLADKFQGETIPTDRADMFVYTRHEPVGVVGAIIPWNAPLLLLAWKLAPALAAGCPVVVKPSDHTPVTAVELGRTLAEAGLPDGAYNVVTGYGPAVGQALTAHPGVHKIAFTGSTATGIAVGRAALGNMTRLTLELGGKSANIVFGDADVEAAVNGAMNAVFIGSGQTCVAGSRLLVHDSLHEEVLRQVVERTKAIRLGSPTDEDTQMGPLVNAAQHQQVLARVERARAEGATVACGGGPVEGLPGLFVAPTVLTDVTPDMEIVQEEVFGPVVTVMRFSTEDEAVELANGTRFGLAAGVWTRDVHRAHRVAHRVKAGTVWVNTYRAYSPAAPFGGYGLSGMGRENGFEAMRDFTELKTVWVELTGATRDPFSVR